MVITGSQQERRTRLDATKRTQSKFQELHFYNPRLSKVGVEALAVRELRRRVSLEVRSAPQRVHFFHLLLVQGGNSKHMVDFVEHELTPGAVVFVRPGQVQQWHLHESLEGQLALISSEALSPSIARSDVDMTLLALPNWPPISTPSPGLFAQAVADITRLTADVKRFEGTDLEAAIIRHELLTLLLRLARELRSSHGGTGATREAEIHALFTTELESHFAKRKSVLYYATRIGFSESTLSRACVAAVGRTAKQEIDERVALEAKRLLVHSHETATQIGHRLGFTEATNFFKFFRRRVGCTPMEFRHAHTA